MVECGDGWRRKLSDETERLGRIAANERDANHMQFRRTGRQAESSPTREFELHPTSLVGLIFAPRSDGEMWLAYA